MKILCALLISLVLVSSAEAAVPRGEAARFQASVRLAAKVFGQPPCGQPRLVWISLPTTTGGMAGIESCIVYLNSHLVLPWLDFCSIVVHEVGHLNGLGHSRRRDSIMYSGPGGLRAFVGCKNFDRRRYSIGLNKTSWAFSKL